MMVSRVAGVGWRSPLRDRVRYDEVSQERNVSSQQRKAMSALTNARTVLLELTVVRKGARSVRKREN